MGRCTRPYCFAWCVIQLAAGITLFIVPTCSRNEIPKSVIPKGYEPFLYVAGVIATINSFVLLYAVVAENLYALAAFFLLYGLGFLLMLIATCRNIYATVILLFILVPPPIIIFHYYEDLKMKEYFNTKRIMEQLSEMLKKDNNNAVSFDVSFTIPKMDRGRFKSV